VIIIHGHLNTIYNNILQCVKFTVLFRFVRCIQTVEIFEKMFIEGNTRLTITSIITKSFLFLRNLLFSKLLLLSSDGRLVAALLRLICGH